MEILPVLAREHAGLLMADLETLHARGEVGHPCPEVHFTVHRLAELAVVDHVDARVQLLLHDVAHGLLQHGGQFRGARRFVAIRGDQ